MVLIHHPHFGDIGVQFDSSTKVYNYTIGGGHSRLHWSEIAPQVYNYALGCNYTLITWYMSIPSVVMY